MRILFVVDGDRDPGALRELTRRILGQMTRRQDVRFNEEVICWSSRRGAFDQKLRAVNGDVGQGGFSMAVAVADADPKAKDGRTGLLETAYRELGRQCDLSARPTALGIADPHFEAWLRDVADGQLAGVLDLAVQRVRDCRSGANDPKAFFSGLARAAGKTAEETLTLAAESIDLEARTAPSGLAAFVARVGEAYRRYEGVQRGALLPCS